MRKLYATSALFALAVGAAWAQPPAKTDPPGTAKAAEPPKKPADPTEATIAAALANDAGIKMARAKVQLAEAELAQAKQAVTLRVVTLRATMVSYRAEYDTAQKRLQLIEKAYQQGQEALSALLDARLFYERSNRALATAEAELKLLTGDGTDAAAQKVIRAFELTDLVSEVGESERVRQMWHLLAQARAAARQPVGPVSERIRAALDKPVKIGTKGGVVKVAEALDAFTRDAGLDVPVRGLDLYLKGDLPAQGELLPVGAWFQMIQDQFHVVAYVREYGILFADPKSAPSDALTVVEFWKQKPATAPAPKK